MIDYDDRMSVVYSTNRFKAALKLLSLSFCISAKKG